MKASTTPLPITTPLPKDEIDYTKIVEEFRPMDWSRLPDNPYYSTADAFFEFNKEPDPTLGNEVTYVASSCRGRGSYKLQSENAYFKVR